MTRDRESADESRDPELEALLSDAGARPRPSNTARDMAYAALREEWQAKATAHRQRRRQRVISMTAAAAVLVTALGVSWRVFEDPSWSAQLAAGTILFDGQAISGEQTLTLVHDDELQATAPVRLVLPAGTDLRLAAGSQARWLSADSLYLSRGRAYVDTRNISDFSIETPYGEVRDIGTRYMVSLEAESMNVAVREGAAVISSTHGESTARAAAQQTAVVHVDRSGIKSHREAASDERWNWIHGVASGYTERTVPALLEAIGRDLGKRVVYANRGVEATIANTSVQGTLANLAPDEALQLVARSAGLVLTETDATITVDFIP